MAVSRICKTNIYIIYKYRIGIILKGRILSQEKLDPELLAMDHTTVNCNQVLQNRCDGISSSHKTPKFKPGWRLRSWCSISAPQLKPFFDVAVLRTAFWKGETRSWNSGLEVNLTKHLFVSSTIIRLHAFLKKICMAAWFQIFYMNFVEVLILWIIL